MDFALLLMALHERLTPTEVEELATPDVEKVIQFKNGFRIELKSCPFDRIWVQVYHKRTPKCYYMSKNQLSTGLAQL